MTLKMIESLGWKQHGFTLVWLSMLILLFNINGRKTKEMNRFRKESTNTAHKSDDEPPSAQIPASLPLDQQYCTSASVHQSRINSREAMYQTAYKVIHARRNSCNYNSLVTMIVLFFTASFVILGPTFVDLISSTGRRSLSSSAQYSFLRKENHDSDCEISYGKYAGQQYYSKESGTVGNTKCLVESKFMRIQQHNVKIPGSNDVYEDWIFIDYHDRINVLVQAPSVKDNDNNEMQFYIFEQSKYALAGRTSLAIIGGIVEPGEDPEMAARREVQEEVNVNCETYNFLGRYRTDVNRGIGWLNSYMALNCSALVDHPSGTAKEVSEEVGAHDVEQQKLQSLSISELKQSLLAGRFLEVQWTATISMALHYIENESITDNSHSGLSII